MATGVIHAGVCGFTINVKAVADEDHKVQLEITSDCPNYQKIALELTEVDAYKEIFNKVHMGRVYEVFAKYSPHASCSWRFRNLENGGSGRRFGITADRYD